MKMHKKLPTVEDLIATEWLLALGNGGYASGTINGPKARSYHGLLIAAFEAPLDRILVLSHIDITWIGDDGETIDFACHVYGDRVIHPKGCLQLVNFERNGALSWTWDCEEVNLRLDLDSPGGNNISLGYVITTKSKGSIRFRPFVCWRSHHGGESPIPFARSVPGGTEVSFPNNPATICFRHEQSSITENLLHENFNYLVEEERGLSPWEDLTSPCYVDWPIQPGVSKCLIEVQVKSGLERKDQASENAFRYRARDRHSATDLLKQATLEFLIESPGNRSPGIIAGYPWFNEWGRDTMIALPGVVAAHGSNDLAEKILLAWTRCLKNGLLPNRLAEGEGECGYNSADAPLWYVRMVRRYYQQGINHPDLISGALQVVDHYLGGTDYQIFVDPADGLLTAGDDQTQLTWMDACFEGHCFTPRNGKCVELNALFFEALNFAQVIAKDLNARTIYERAAEKLKASFREKFYDQEVGLKDCLSDKKAMIRPNQLFAIACVDNLLGDEKKEQSFIIVRDSLLTPVGIRSLAPSDPSYQGRYEGGPKERDGAYHQGTVWMWLMGSFIDAHFSVFGKSPKQIQVAETYVSGCLENLRVGMLGQLNEIFDGDHPFQPRGAPAQAWSASELERVILDWDLNRTRIDIRCRP